MNDEQIAKVVITEEVAKEIVEMLMDGKLPSEICVLCCMSPGQFSSFLRGAIFDPVGKRTPGLQIIRDGILKILLTESIIGEALRILSNRQVTTKEIEVLALSAQEKKALQRKGYDSFIESAEKASVLLKVERTTAPPPVALLEKLLKLVGGDISVEDMSKQWAGFCPVDPRLEDV